MAAIQGGCLCSNVRYEYTGRYNPHHTVVSPAKIGIGDIALKAFCNCKDCQKWGGAPGMANVVVPRDTFKVIKGKKAIGTLLQSSFHHADKMNTR